MSRAQQIDYIVIHCTAGHQPAKKVQDYFKRPTSQGGRGWNTGGYHIIIEKDGEICIFYPFDKITNGVRNYNSKCIHISYVGGVDPDDYSKAKDTRTPEQKLAIERAIQMALDWIEDNGADPCKVMILGHRDFSPDRDGSGVIESWERIKECPSYDAIKEYNHKYGGGSLQTLPFNR